MGRLLREWRRRRGLSQLDLAIRAQVSARHVSFVETGRTRPSSAMVLHLAEHLAVPLSERNRLLVAAGHAPTFRQCSLDTPEAARVHTSVQRVLRGHEPYPALAMDHHWNLLLANQAAEVLLDGAAPALLRPPVNMMRLGLHPDGLAPRVANHDQVRAYLLPRLARQVARTGDPWLAALYEELLAHGPSDSPDGDHTRTDPADIALTICLRHRGRELRLVNTITTFGAAFDITLEDIVIEVYLPADTATARFFGTA